MALPSKTGGNLRFAIAGSAGALVIVNILYFKLGCVECMPTSYLERYQNTIAALARPLTSKDKVPAEQLRAGERRQNVPLPKALRDFYLLAGQCDRLNQAHNRLYMPDEWFVDAGKLVFMEENQTVVYWGIEASVQLSADPPIFQGVNVINRAIEWHHEHNCFRIFGHDALLASGVWWDGVYWHL